MLIGLTGYARVGKDTAGRILVERYGLKRYAFADKLREFVYYLNPLVIAKDDNCLATLREVVDRYGWDEVKDRFPLARAYLQDVGVWFRKNVAEDYWVRIVAQNWLLDGKPDAVITDVRFPNEVSWVRSNQGVIVRVNRDGYGPVNGHESEKAHELPCDLEITNPGSLDGFTAELSKVFPKIKNIAFTRLVDASY